MKRPTHLTIEAVRRIFSMHAQKTGQGLYGNIAEITISSAEDTLFERVLNSNVSPERHGMVLALLAARAVVLEAKKLLNQQNPADGFNAFVFDHIRAQGQDMNVAKAEEPTPPPEAEMPFMLSAGPALDMSPEGSIEAAFDPLDPPFEIERIGGPKATEPAFPFERMLSGGGFERLLRAIRESGAEDAWFDHQVYAAALKMLGADVPADVIDIVKGHKAGSKSVDLVGLMKDDLIPQMIDDAAAYLHRCHMYVKHQVPAMPGMSGRPHGGMPGGGFYTRIIIG